VTGMRGRRHKQLLDDLKEKTEYRKLTEEALDRTLLRIRFGRSYGLVLKQTKRMNDECSKAVFVLTYTKNKERRLLCMVR
jgi:hypothetical protein